MLLSKLNRSLSFIVITLLFFGAHAPFAYAQENAQDEGAIFSDVKKGTRHYVAIAFVNDSGIFAGNPDGSFGPYEEINRASAATALVRLMEQRQIQKSAPIPETLPFSDVPADAWFADAVRKALAFEIIKGNPDGTFRPDATMNRAEAIAMIFRALRIQPAEIKNLPPDVPADAWFAPAASFGINHFIMNHDDEGNFKPEDSVTRGGFAQIMYRTIYATDALRYLGKQDFEYGRASWYADGLSVIRVEKKMEYHDRAHTAAHKTYPIGTVLRVTNLDNGNSVDVLVNDRGPFVPGRIIDLSKSSFAVIGDPGNGILRNVHVIPLTIPGNDQ